MLTVIDRLALGVATVDLEDRRRDRTIGLDVRLATGRAQ
jgi:hypothetical protein